MKKKGRQASCCTETSKRGEPQAQPVARGNLPAILTWESEVRYIAAESFAWRIETGGDLFGLWEEQPLIYLATRAGPNAIREAAHFRLDVPYLRALSQQLATNWSLRYLGDWHSHHRLGLTAPSHGDQRRLRNLAIRNSFPGMAEVIVTLEGEVQEAHKARLHPWIYTGDALDTPAATRLDVLPGISPLREALISIAAIPEQEMTRWGEVNLDSVGGIVCQSGTPGVGSSVLQDRVAASLLSAICAALEDVSGRQIERQETAFGTVVAAAVDDTHLIGFAIGRHWPCRILEVDWIDRTRGTAEPVSLPLPTSLLTPPHVVALYKAARQHATKLEAAVDVDQVPD